MAGALDGAGLERVLSSPFLRCVQSVEPLAAAHHLTVERVDALAEGDARAAVELVRRLAGRAAALCTHGDIVPEVLAALAADGLRLPPRPRWAKGSTWVLRTHQGRFVHADYVPAPRA